MAVYPRVNGAAEWIGEFANDAAATAQAIALGWDTAGNPFPGLEYFNTATLLKRFSDGAGNWVEYPAGGGGYVGVNVIYVGKHGNDANSGADEANAKLTIGAGITAVDAIGGGRVHVIDGGTYIEDIDLQFGVSTKITVHAPDATLQGGVRLGAGRAVHFDTIDHRAASARAGAIEVQGAAGTFAYAQARVVTTEKQGIIGFQPGNLLFRFDYFEHTAGVNAYACLYTNSTFTADTKWIGIIGEARYHQYFVWDVGSTGAGTMDLRVGRLVATQSGNTIIGFALQGQAIINATVEDWDLNANGSIPWRLGGANAKLNGEVWKTNADVVATWYPPAYGGGASPDQVSIHETFQINAVPGTTSTTFTQINVFWVPMSGPATRAMFSARLPTEAKRFVRARLVLVSNAIEPAPVVNVSGALSNGPTTLINSAGAIFGAAAALTATTIAAEDWQTEWLPFLEGATGFNTPLRGNQLFGIDLYQNTGAGNWGAVALILDYLR